MNKEIKELAKQAQLEHCVSHVRLEQFAQLIIKECCEKMLTLEVKYPANLTVREIKQHFGIEK